MEQPPFDRERAGWRREITFAGRRWGVKDSGGDLTGPGPNRFSDDPRNVRVDAEGRLHLAITEREGRRRCAEVALLEPLGYGTYTFTVAGPPVFDPQVVLGLFLYADDRHEIDVELSAFGGEIRPNNAQFAVQPLGPGEQPFISRFALDPAWTTTTHVIDWQLDRVAFKTECAGVVVATARTVRGVPVDRPGNPLRSRINVWLYAGDEVSPPPPAHGEGREAVIAGFDFAPA